MENSNEILIVYQNDAIIKQNAYIIALLSKDKKGIIHTRKQLDKEIEICNKFTNQFSEEKMKNTKKLKKRLEELFPKGYSINIKIHTPKEIEIRIQLLDKKTNLVINAKKFEDTCQFSFNDKFLNTMNKILSQELFLEFFNIIREEYKNDR